MSTAMDLSDLGQKRKGSTQLSGLKTGVLSSRLDDLIDSIPDAEEDGEGDFLSVQRVSSMESCGSSHSDSGDSSKMCTAHLEKVRKPSHVGGSPLTISQVLAENISIAKAVLTVAEYRGSFSMGVDMANVLTAVGMASENVRVLLKWIAKKAVEEPEGTELLFREENVFTTFLSHIVLLEGRLFLISTLRRCMKPIVGKKTNFEIDPNRELSEAARKQNLKALVGAVESTFKCIFEGIVRLSTTIRCALRMVHYAVNKRFGPEAALQAVGGIFFLRFFCPNLVSPEKYGILRGVSGPQRRKLILLSKFVQLIANKTHSTGTEWVDEVLDKLWTKKFEKKMDDFYHTLMNGGRRSSSYLETLSNVDRYVNASARKVTRFVLGDLPLIEQNTTERCSLEWDSLPADRRQAIAKREEAKKKRAKKSSGLVANKPLVQIPVTNLVTAVSSVRKCKRTCQPRHYRRIHATGSTTNFASG